MQLEDNKNFIKEIQSTKKIELHRHIEGCIKPDYFQKLVLKYEPDSVFTELIEIDNLFNFSNFQGFLNAYSTVVSFLKEKYDLIELGIEVLKQLENENIVYAELIFSPQPLMKKGMMLEDILEVLYNVFKHSRIKTILIIDIVRNFGAKEAELFVDELINILSPDLRDWIKAISIGGDEYNYPPKLFIKSFQKARNNRLWTYAHAGEWAVVNNIWDTIKLLNTSRIGHGIRSVDDLYLMKHLVDKNITLDLSLTSNYATGAVKKNLSHPILLLIEKGVNISINTDDPGFFKTDLNNEYLMASRLGIDINYHKEIPLKCIENTFLSKDEKSDLINILNKNR